MREQLNENGSNSFCKKGGNSNKKDKQISNKQFRLTLKRDLEDTRPLKRFKGWAL